MDNNGLILACLQLMYSKLVLANKMYGLPYLDLSGEYGISNRDNYVIYKENNEDLIKLSEFLSTELVKKVYESTRYRMKYLEKYAFELLPDIFQPIIDFQLRTAYDQSHKSQMFLPILKAGIGTSL